MYRLTDQPPSTGVISDPHNVWIESSEHHKYMLKEICQRIVKQSIYFRIPWEKCSVYWPGTHVLLVGPTSRMLVLGVLRQYSGEKRWCFSTISMYQLPQGSQQVLRNRFVNAHSLPGHNIPGDPHQAHLNPTWKVNLRPRCKQNWNWNSMCWQSNRETFSGAS